MKKVILGAAGPIGRYGTRCDSCSRGKCKKGQAIKEAEELE